MATAAQTTDYTARLMVGLEIHVELGTRSKMFTSAPNVAHPDFYDALPNTLTDPVVLGMPGVLPVINKQAVEMSMLVGMSLGCEIARFTKWDRKSYYYPDLPKNYQISQYDKPLCSEGMVEIPLENGGTKKVRIIRAHLEEDAGKLLHEGPGGVVIDHSVVDLNRAGTPLLEIVTYPDFESAEEVVAFGQALRNICRSLGVTQGIMQKGHMRFEPNINVVIESPRGSGKFFKTPIVEIKNLNSFKSLLGSVQYEYHRQVEEWLDTGVTMRSGTKSTRGWDDITQTTYLQREKEEAHDYRYFPDPDLVSVVIDDAWIARVKSKMTELPQQREVRYIKTLGLGEKEARTIVDEPVLTGFFEELLAVQIEPRRACALVLNNLSKRANERGVPITQLGVTASQLKAIDTLSKADKISSGAADSLIGFCCEPAHLNADPEKLAMEQGLLQVSDDGALDEWITQAIEANPKSVEAVKGGKESAIGALTGAVMKLSKGKANPKVVGQKLKERLMS